MTEPTIQPAAYTVKLNDTTITVHPSDWNGETTWLVPIHVYPTDRDSPLNGLNRNVAYPSADEATAVAARYITALHAYREAVRLAEHALADDLTAILPPAPRAPRLNP